MQEEKIGPIEADVLNVGGSLGIIIPAYFCRVGNIEKGTRLKVMIEEVTNAERC